MINRENWLLVKKHLEYRREILLNDPKTVRAGWVALRHVLQWADSTPFTNAHRIRPGFSDYLIGARNDGNSGTLKPSHMQKVSWYARNFFTWLREEHPSKYKNISAGWVRSIRPRREYSQTSQLIEHQYWTLEEIRKVLEYPTNTLKYQRDKAALAFMFLSAMRGAAFVTMPIKSVDVENHKVYQLPEWGVKTKNSKAAITFLLPIPDLLEVVRDWDAYVRANTESTKSAWYSRLNTDGMEILRNDIPAERSPSGRRSAFYEGLKELCNLAGVEFKSPHKVRHGHGMYGVMHAQTPAEFKAISQNMMHETVDFTDRKYGGLKSDSVGEIIRTLKPDTPSK